MTEDSEHATAGRALMMRSLAVSALAALALACAGDSLSPSFQRIGSDVPSGSSATLELLPTTASIVVGGSLQLSAAAHAKDGSATSASFTWTSEHPNVATVDATGRVTGIGAGSTFVQASALGMTVSSLVMVTEAQPPSTSAASVTITPSTAVLLPGGTLRFVATARDAAGTILTGHAVTWSSGTPAIASVDTTGGVRALSQGDVSITATVDGQSGSARLSVLPVPAASVSLTPGSGSIVVSTTLQLSATARDSSGNVLSRPISWTSTAPSVAAVNANGLVRGLSAGVATITATADGRSASADVTVRLVPVAAVSVSPASASVAPYANVQLTATTTDSAGKVLAGRVVTWSSSAPTVATVNGFGSVTGLSAGSATITATSEGKSASAAIAVAGPTSPTTPPPVTAASVTVSPTTATVAIGSTTQLTAAPRDSAGAALTGRTITWSSSATGVATVNASGLVSGVAAGAATITATVDGKSASAAITVPAPPAPPPPVTAASVTVSPTTATVAIGSTTQLTATPRDSAGNTLTGRTITWSSSASGVASVNASGLVTGVAAGAATITAIVDGKSASATITVPAPPAPPPPVTAASVTVSPTMATVAIGSTNQLTATPRDSAGATLTGRTITWSSSATLVATVNASGLVTGVAAGSATITATVDGKSASAAITVPAPPAPPPPVTAASVTVSPTTASLLTGGTVQLTATPRDSAGATLTGRTITWSSSAMGVATVNASGLVSGVAAGAATITATVDGKSAGASVTVSAPAPPVPGALHEPAGMTTILNDDGSVLVPGGTTATTAWSGIGWTGAAHTALIADPSNPTGSGHAIEKYWYTGMGTDAAAQPGIISVWHWSTVNPAFHAVKTVYLRMRVWFSANWPLGDGNRAGMKFFYLRTSHSSSDLLFTSIWPDGRLHFATNTGLGPGPNQLDYDTWAGSLKPLGTWHTIEFLFTMNSALDVADGGLAMWIDGSQISNRSDICYVGAKTTPFSLDFDGMEMYNLRGTVNYTFTQNDQYRMGELYISGR